MGKLRDHHESQMVYKKYMVEQVDTPTAGSGGSVKTPTR
jgi:hypothetical protein